MTLKNLVIAISAITLIGSSSAFAAGQPCRREQSKVNVGERRVDFAEMSVERAQDRMSMVTERNEISLANYDARIETFYRRYVQIHEDGDIRKKEAKERGFLCFGSGFLCPSLSRLFESVDRRTEKAFRDYQKVKNNRSSAERIVKARHDAAVRGVKRYQDRLKEEKKRLAEAQAALAACEAKVATPPPAA